MLWCRRGLEKSKIARASARAINLYYMKALEGQTLNQGIIINRGVYWLGELRIFLPMGTKHDSNLGSISFLIGTVAVWALFVLG